MAQAFFLFGLLAAMPLAMWWMISASRKARARMRDSTPADEVIYSRNALEEVETGADGLAYGKAYAGDGAVLPPDDASGETAGIKALQGRR